MAEREKRLFKIVVESYKRSDIEKAKMYANEVAEVRKWLRRIEQASLELEAIMLRLETINEVGEYAAPLGNTLSYIIGLLRNVKYIRDVYPEFDTLTETLKNMSNEITGEPFLPNEHVGLDIDTLTNKPEVSRILEEARTLVSIKRREMKEVPDMYIERGVRLAEASGVGVVPTTKLERMNLDDKNITVNIEKKASVSLEELVYRWAVAHNGVINIKECAANLGIDPDDVVTTVKKLLAEGRFRLA